MIKYLVLAKKISFSRLDEIVFRWDKIVSSNGQDRFLLRQDIISLGRDSFSFQQDVISFERDIISLEPDIISFGQDSFSLGQDSFSLGRDSFSFQQDFYLVRTRYKKNSMSPPSHRSSRMLNAFFSKSSFQVKINL